MENIEKTLRDEIAIAVLPEILKASGQLQHGYGGCTNILLSDCQLAYRIADAMIQVKEGNQYLNAPSTISKRFTS